MRAGYPITLRSTRGVSTLPDKVRKAQGRAQRSIAAYTSTKIIFAAFRAFLVERFPAGKASRMNDPNIAAW